MYLFLSHSSKDYEVVKEACTYLEGKGYRCFLASRDIRGGHLYAEEIVEGIERSDVLLLFLSKEANSSPHVLREIERAVSKNIPIIVYKLGEVQLSKAMEYFLMSQQWINADSGKGYESLVDFLKTIFERKHMQYITKQEGTKKKKGFFSCKLFICAGVFILLVVLSICGWNMGKKEQVKDAYVSQEADIIRISPGDTIILGQYLGAPIEWRVLKISEDGRKAVLVSKYILTMKAFDAAESGKYNTLDNSYYQEGREKISKETKELQQKLRGSNEWGSSNIRTWLNSAKENVYYEQGTPHSAAMSSLLNGYDTEPGFLNGFTEKEREAICNSVRETNGITSEEKVFLLSAEELHWFQEADVNIKAIPTPEALEQDKTQWYEIYALDLGVDDYYWWLRDADTKNYYEAYMVCNSYSVEKLMTTGVGLEGFGIRPALTLDLQSEWMHEYTGGKE